MTQKIFVVSVPHGMGPEWRGAWEKLRLRVEAAAQQEVGLGAHVRVGKDLDDVESDLEDAVSALNKVIQLTADFEHEFVADTDAGRDWAKADKLLQEAWQAVDDALDELRGT